MKFPNIFFTMIVGWIVKSTRCRSWGWHYECCRSCWKSIGGCSEACWERHSPNSHQWIIPKGQDSLVLFTLWKLCILIRLKSRCVLHCVASNFVYDVVYNVCILKNWIVWNNIGVVIQAAAKCVEILESMATPMKLDDRQSLLMSATTSLGSKVVSQHSSLLAPLAVDAVLKVIDPQCDTDVDLRVCICHIIIFSLTANDSLPIYLIGYPSHKQTGWNSWRYRAGWWFGFGSEKYRRNWTHPCWKSQDWSDSILHFSTQNWCEISFCFLVIKMEWHHQLAVYW